MNIEEELSRLRAHLADLYVDMLATDNLEEIRDQINEKLHNADQHILRIILEMYPENEQNSKHS